MPLAKGDDDVEEVGRGLGRMFPARPTRCGCMVDQPFSRYSMQCTAALWLTPSITAAGLAPTRAWEGQTIREISSEFSQHLGLRSLRSLDPGARRARIRSGSMQLL